MAKVDVKLTHPALVNGQIRQAGETVEMDPKIATQFGEVQGIDLLLIPDEPAKVTRKRKARTK